MKVPLYILGFLMRYGPQHGYLLQQHIEREASDFAVIHSSNIYYHLERLKNQGYVESTFERDGRRPDRQVFAITESGKSRFNKLIHKAASDRFKGEYLFDATLFFFEYLDHETLGREIEEQIQECQLILTHIQTHQKETMAHVPRAHADAAKAIFNHHAYHYQAELKWLEEIRALLMGK